MGLRSVWRFGCDMPGCRRRFEVTGGKMRQARYRAFQERWQTDGGDGWFCPVHADEALKPRRGDHESWCPQATRRGLCACRQETATADDAMTGIGRQEVHRVSVDPRLGQIL